VLQRISDQHKISFLEGEKSSESPRKKAELSRPTIQQVLESQRSKRLENKYKENGIMNSQSIFSARTGVIKDNGGPIKHIKSESSNTLWDSNKTSRLLQEVDSKTKTIQEKASISDNRRYAEKQRMDAIVDVLKSTDQTKASAVSSVGTFSGSNYKNRSKDMSIFDSKDFERLPEKTGGEQVKESNGSRYNQKDDSWRGESKSIKSSDIVSDFFNKLLDKRDE